MIGQGQNATMQISSDDLNLFMTALSQLNIKQNEIGEIGQQYIDSGAAAHVINDVGKLLVSSYWSWFYITRDTTHHPISHTGSTSILVKSSKIPLSNVLVAPAIKKNILSVSKLVDDNNSSVDFTPSSMYVKDPCTKKILAEGQCCGNMSLRRTRGGLIVFRGIIYHNYFPGSTMLQSICFLYFFES